MANWQATNELWNQGSFQSPVPAPNIDPAAAPVVCVQFGAAWLPYVLGSLFQLTQPAIWDPASPGAADATTQAQSLMSIFSAAGVCTDMLTFQFTSGCGLQYSLDGGTTWIDVPGWSTFAPGCFTGATGPAGPSGGYSPGTPGNPFGTTTQQQACNIAAYLAADVLQVAMAQQVNNYNTAKSLIDSVGAIFGAIAVVDPIWEFAVAAGVVLYNAYTALTIADFTAASTDATLLSEMKCAIYSAIEADGFVDSSNFASVATALGAISYPHTEVITAIVDFWNSLTLVGVEQLQLTGSMYVGDCADCGAPNASALFFQGDPASMSLATDVDLGTAFTLGGWFNTSSTPASGTWVVLFFGKAPGSNRGCLIYITSGLTLQCYIQGTTTGSNMSASLPSGVNVHIAVTCDGTTARMYIDGAEVASMGVSAGPYNNSGGASLFGRDPSGADSLIAVVWGWAAYTTALPGSSITAWYASGTFATPPSGYNNYWPMDDGLGSSVADVAGGDTGTLAAPYLWTTHS